MFEFDKKNISIKYIIGFLLIIQFNFAFSQNKKNHYTKKKEDIEKVIEVGISNQCLRNLLNVCSFNCLNGNETLNSFAFIKFGLRWGASYNDSATSFKNAEYNEWMRDKIFILFYNSYKEWMITNFIGLGVKPIYSEQLSQFLYYNIDKIKERDRLYENRTNNVSVTSETEKKVSYEVVEYAKKPMWKYETRTLNQYLSDNFSKLTYDKGELEGKRIYVDFIIQKDGSIKVNKVRYLDSSLEVFKKNIIDIFENMPLWTPAELEDGRKVGYMQSIPINF